MRYEKAFKEKAVKLVLKGILKPTLSVVTIGFSILALSSSLHILYLLLLLSNYCLVIFPIVLVLRFKKLAISVFV